MSRFHAAVTSQHELTFAGDLKALAALKGLAAKFLHSVMDELCGRAPDYTPYQKALGCSEDDLERLSGAYRTYITQAMGRNLKIEQIIEDLKAAGLPENAVGSRDSGIASIIVSRHEEVRLALSTAAHVDPHLKDYDWKVNLTLASDTVASLKKPVLMLRLDVEESLSRREQRQQEQAGQPAQEPLLLELNKNDVAKLITQLEEMNSAVRSVLL